MSQCRAHRPGERCHHIDTYRLAERIAARASLSVSADELLAAALAAGLSARIHPRHGRVMVDVPGQPFSRTIDSLEDVRFWTQHRKG